MHAFRKSVEETGRIGVYREIVQGAMVTNECLIEALCSKRVMLKWRPARSCILIRTVITLREGKDVSPTWESIIVLCRLTRGHPQRGGSWWGWAWSQKT